MFNNMPEGTKIVEASEEDLLAAIGETDTEDKSKGKKSDTGGSDDDTDDTDTGSKEKTKKVSKKSSGKGKSAIEKKISDMSKDDFEIALGGDDDEEEEDEEEETNLEEDEEEDEDEGKKKDDESEEDEDEEDEDEDEGDLTVNKFLKARVDFLIKKGEWVDFEGRTDVEWDEDNFAEMELKQRAYQKELMAEEILDDFGPTGRQIAEYVVNGGNPDDLIDIFKEQKVVDNLSIESEDQQRDVVYKYATEFQNMRPERAKKYIDSLVADKELAEVAKEAKDNMTEDLKAQAEELQKSQQRAAQQKETRIQENIKKFSTDVNSFLTSNKEIPDDEKQELAKVLTRFNKKLQNGTPVNDFYFRLAEFRKDLPNYINLVRFVLNPKKFMKSAENKGKTEEAEKAFSLIRTSNKGKKVKSVDVNTGDKKSGKKQVSGFKLMY